MSYYDDETLGAYVDGELDRETAAALEADLRIDPVLRRQVAELRSINLALREWCAEQARPGEIAWPSVPAMRQARRPRGARAFAPLWSHALAASIALLLGISIAQFVNLSWRSRDVDADGVPRQLLQAALEHKLSGQTISWTDDIAKNSITVQPLRTYRASGASSGASSGTYCREYRETAVMANQPNERTMYGLACRSPEGTWSVEYTLAPGARALLANQ